MLKILIQQGLQQQKQDSDGDGTPDKLDKFPGQNDSWAARRQAAKDRLEIQRQAKEAIQDIAGLLIGEYYHDRNAFASDKGMVKEMQEDLIKLGYDIGNSGADGKLGAKTKTAMHNFEQDHAVEMKTAADIQRSINKGWQK
ncbi:MAG: peptidoglycan-binding protein [Bacteroidetes bacterium]|nr:peptidoglycan-binding protein [Bacteroidota bacterium]